MEIKKGEIIKEEIESRLAPNQIYRYEIVSDDTEMLLKLPPKRR
jgi:hypothetical protein